VAHAGGVGQLAGAPGALPQLVDHLPANRVGESDQHLVHIVNHAGNY
jgi:hypothetical protein